MSGFSIKCIRSSLSTRSEGEYNIKFQYKGMSITTSVFSTTSKFSTRSEFSTRSGFSKRSRFSTRKEFRTKSGTKLTGGGAHSLSELWEIVGL